MLRSVQPFVLEQWHMGVCVCVLSHVQLHQLGGIWGCVCVCVHVQLCLTLLARAVAYGSVRVCVCVCVR